MFLTKVWMLPVVGSGNTARWRKFLCTMRNYLPGVKSACSFEGIPWIDCVAKKQVLPRDAGNEQISAGGGKVLLNCVITVSVMNRILST